MAVAQPLVQRCGPANRLRDSPDRNSIIILLTDGENNSGDLAPLGAAEAASS